MQAISSLVAPTKAKVALYAVSTHSVKSLWHDLAQADYIALAVSSAEAFMVGPKPLNRRELTMEFWIKAT